MARFGATTPSLSSLRYFVEQGDSRKSQIETNYTLQRFSRNEFIVINKFGDRVGTIRRLSPASWGWRDLEGLHEYPSRDEAASACLASALSRQRRQNSRRWRLENVSV